MTYAFVLIVMTWGGYNAHYSVDQVHDFSTEQTCEAARAAISAALMQDGPGSRKPITVCVRK